MNLFLTLLLSHLVADFPLQSDSIIRMKSRGQFGLILHSLIHVVVAAALLHDPLTQWPILLMLGIAHWLIDWTKISVSKESTVIGFLVDQAVHVLSIILILGTSGYLAVVMPTAMLPVQILLMAVLYGTMLGFMVLLWLWSNTLSEDVIQRYPTIQWTRAQMLRCSQQAGMALIGGLVFGLFYFSQFTCC